MTLVREILHRRGPCAENTIISIVVLVVRNSSVLVGADELDTQMDATQNRSTPRVE